MTSPVPVRFRTYQSDKVQSVWAEVSPLIQRALDKGSSYTLEQVKEGLEQAKMQLWTCETDKIHAALVTSLQDGYCLLLTMGGSGMSVWKDWLPSVENWARTKGCNEMRIYGRCGWSKVLGYTVDYTKMSKAL